MARRRAMRTRADAPATRPAKGASRPGFSLILTRTDAPGGGRCVHLFACMFYRVKKDSAASAADVATFFSSRGVDDNVSARPTRLGSTRIVRVGRSGRLGRIARLGACPCARPPFPEPRLGSNAAGVRGVRRVRVAHASPWRPHCLTLPPAARPQDLPKVYVRKPPPPPPSPSRTARNRFPFLRKRQTTACSSGWVAGRRLPQPTARAKTTGF